MKLLKLVPDHTNLDFMRWRNLALILSLIATVASIGYTVYRGLNLGIDFVGGQVVRVEFAQPVHVERAARPRSTRLGVGEASIQAFGGPKHLPDPPAQAARAGDAAANRWSSKLRSRDPAAISGRPRSTPGESVSGKVSEELARGQRHGDHLRDARDRDLHLVPVRMAVRGRARC